jgi:hypothetical protein
MISYLNSFIQLLFVMETQCFLCEVRTVCLKIDYYLYKLHWTTWHWGRFSPCTSVSPAISYSTDRSTLIYHP